MIEASTVFTCIKNPFSFIEMSIVGTAAGAGQAAAYMLIRDLPKLKQEPEITPQQGEIAASTSENTVNQTHATLRKRTVSL